MLGSPYALTRPLLNSAGSTGSGLSWDEEDVRPLLPASLNRLPCDGFSDASSVPARDVARRNWFSWWPRRTRAIALTPPVTPPRSPPPLPAPPAMPGPLRHRSAVTIGEVASPPEWQPQARRTYGPGHALGMLVGVLGCGVIGAIFGLQYAGRLNTAYEGLEGVNDFGVDTRWMYLPVVAVFAFKAACFGWAVAQLHQCDGWRAPELLSATTRNIEAHGNPALRRRLHWRLALGVAAGVAQAAFCGWHYASLHNGGWRMAVFPYLLPVIDLPATWATVRYLFVPLADACGPEQEKAEAHDKDLEANP